MSYGSVQLSGSSSVQDVVYAIRREFDTNKDGQFAMDEFAGFLSTLLGSTGAYGASAIARGSAAASAGGGSNAAGSSEAYRGRMLGFDFSRMESARGSLKYDAAALMQGIDPSSPGAMQAVFDQLIKLHPGAYSLDAQNNLMLDGTADGYIGVRPLNRNENWDNAPSGYCWQWMGYNEAHPGPNGEMD
jgi:hypothetical protein